MKKFLIGLVVAVLAFIGVATATGPVEVTPSYGVHTLIPLPWPEPPAIPYSYWMAFGEQPYGWPPAPTPVMHFEGDDLDYLWQTEEPHGYKGRAPGLTKSYRFFDDGTYQVWYGSPPVVIETGAWF